jgi:hypothetical protein
MRKDDAKNGIASADSSDLNDACGRFDGATMHERLSLPDSSISSNASSPDAAYNSVLAVCAAERGACDRQDVYRKAVTSLLDVKGCGAWAQDFATELKILRERGVTAERVFQMDHAELAVSMAAHKVSYEQVWLSQFVSLRSRLVDIFFEQTVSGSLLVGDHAMPRVEFLELVFKGLNANDAFRPTEGQKAA